MPSSLTLFAAGSLRRAFIPLIERFTAQTAIPVNLNFGPAGLLRERIEAGEACDVFASANTQHPQTLIALGLARESQIFARNTLILTARRHLEGDALTLLRNPDLRLATSTPGCDPSGDYTWQLFDNLNSLEPGLGEQLKSRAVQLVGGRDSLSIPSGEIASKWLLQQDLTDLFIGYAHYAAALMHDDTLRVVELPHAQNIRCDYHVARLAESENAQKLYAFILADVGQRCLRDAGFLAVN
jgi:molybdenum ABC transporter, periplasmic molybdate-binding protein